MDHKHERGHYFKNNEGEGRNRKKIWWIKREHQKDKQKEQQKENEITKISQEKKILEAVVKTLGNCDRIKINHAPGKDQQIKDLQIQLQKEKDTGKTM